MANSLHSNILIIFNPNAGRGKAQLHAEHLANELEKSGIMVGQLFKAESVDLMRQFHASNANNVNKYSMAVIIGGDGTLGPNIDAMIKNNVFVPIYALGRGTANDFASYYRTNKSIKKAVKIITEARTRQVDTMQVDMPNNAMNVHYAVSDAAGGAFTNGVTKYSTGAKRVFGKLAYKTKGALSALRLKSQPVRFTVDGESFDATIFLFYILNGQNVGGIKKAGSLARPDDELLDLVCIKRCGLFGKLRIAFSLLFKRLHKCKHIIYRQGKSFKIEVIGPDVIHNFTKTDTDGNIGGDYPLNVCVGPKITVITNI